MNKLRYTAEEAAKVLSVEYTHLMRMLRAGKINGYKDGRRWYITPAELERYQFEQICKHKGIDAETAYKALQEINDQVAAEDMFKLLEKEMKK